MILYEFEGKKLLSKGGITIPNSQLITSPDEQITINYPVVLKAQLLSGKRADAGGIITVDNPLKIGEELDKLFTSIINEEKVEKVLVEEKIQFVQEYYISLSYNTDLRFPIIAFSQEGGTGIEDRKVNTIRINPLNPIENITQDKLFGLPEGIITKLIHLFFDQDCLLLEVNPLVKTVDDQWMALDAKVKLDDNAIKRHTDWPQEWRIPRSTPGHTPTQNEIEAKKIDENDYRGVAGSTYFDLDGDIAVLASGGGASLTALDELIKLGGKPANYTEYGGNPPKEKVEKLTEIVLSKPNLCGLWVVGAVANFTDIYETLSGFIEGLRNVRAKKGLAIDFPIVIRRGGPRDKEAFEMLKQIKDFDLHLFGEETPITKSAKIIVGLAKEYKHKKQTTNIPISDDVLLQAAS